MDNIIHLINQVKLKKSSIKLIAYDFDGVLTDNKVIIDENGNESVSVNRSDGLAISKIKMLGIEQIIISSELIPIAKKRAQKLQIKCIHGAANKKQILMDYLNEVNLELKNVIFIGNDINDFDVMKIAGWPICPMDAHKSIRKISKIIIKRYGGDGIVRELYDLLKGRQD